MNSKQKGKRGEREAAKEISKVLGLNARRGVQYQGSPESPDVVTDDETRLHWEVKRTEKLRLYQAVDQAKGDASDEQVSILLHRKNGKQWLMVIEFEDLPKLYEVLKDVL